jgi:hypothetical protein
MNNHRGIKSQNGQKTKSEKGAFIAGDRMALSPMKRESCAIVDSQITK